MKCKAFDVVLELEIQAVTCPGVWLCPNGKVTVQICLLGLCSQTSTLNPVFPLLFHEKFSFRKNFPNVQNLYELDHKLNRELVYMELIQWEDCESGNVLATFKTSLMELLYPFPKRKGVLTGVDVDLLMEATTKFPGIIAPKIEISTKITIKEILCSVKNEKKNEVVVVNPKLISSKCVPKRHTPMRQRKVCHTYRYHRAQATKSNSYDCTEKCCPRTKDSQLSSPEQISPRKSSFNYQPEDKLTKEYVYDKIQKVRNKCNCKSTDAPCICKDKKMICPLCANYKNYFKNSSSSGVKQPDDNRKDFESVDTGMSSMHRCGYNTPIENSPRSYICSHKSKSRASEIHERLQKSLSSVTSLSLDKDDMHNIDTCADKFYKNLEQFYKQLYMRAHYKLKNERCKCGK